VELNDRGETVPLLLFLLLLLLLLLPSSDLARSPIAPVGVEETAGVSPFLLLLLLLLLPLSFLVGSIVQRWPPVRGSRCGPPTPFLLVGLGVVRLAFGGGGEREI